MRQKGEYSTKLDDYYAFQLAVINGYFATADFVIKNGNKGNFGFVYTTDNIMGRKGVTTNSASGPLDEVNASLATTRPLSQGELLYYEEKTGLNIRYVFYGIFINENLQILGHFKIK